MEKTSIIRKKPDKNKWCVYSHDGKKNLGCYPSEAKAEKRLKQIEFFKHQGQSKEKKFEEWQDSIGYALLSRGIIEGFPETTVDVIIDILVKKDVGPIEDIKEFAERYVAGERFKPQIDWTKKSEYDPVYLSEITREQVIFAPPMIYDATVTPAKIYPLAEYNPGNTFDYDQVSHTVVDVLRELGMEPDEDYGLDEVLDMVYEAQNNYLSSFNFEELAEVKKALEELGEEGSKEYEDIVYEMDNGLSGEA